MHAKNVAVMSIAVVLCAHCERVCFAAPPHGASEDTVRALRDAVLQWTRVVSFHCKWEMSVARFESVEEALDGRLFDRQVKQTGVFHKLGDRYRFSIAYSDPYVLEGSSATNAPVDEMGGPQVGVSFHMPAQEYAGSAMAFAPTVAGTGPAQELMCRRLMGPLNVGGGQVGEPLRLNGAADNMKTEVSDIDAEHLQVSFSDVRGPERRAYTVVLWMATDTPTVERSSLVSQFASGLTNSSYSRAMDFVACPGGLVARRIVSVHVVGGGSVPKQTQAFEWRSADLGDVAPTEEDFVMEVPETVFIHGLVRPPPMGTKRLLDLNALGPDDLAPPGPIFPEPSEAKNGPSRSPRAMLVAGLGAAVGLALCAYWLWCRNNDPGRLRSRK